MIKITVAPKSLVVMVGASASGKSTMAHEYFSKAAVVSSDDCRELVCGDATRQDINREAFELFHSIIRTRMRLGVTTVADATNLKPNSRTALYKLAKEYGRPVLNIIVDTPLESLRANNEARNRKVPDFVLERHTEQFNSPTGARAAMKEQESSYVQFGQLVRSELTVAVVPEMQVHSSDTEWWVIGDIHGCYDELIQLMNKIPVADRIAFVGDFVDRGPMPAEVLGYVRQLLRTERAIAVRGNHDWKLYRGMVENRAIEWSPMALKTKELITDGMIKFINELPYQAHIKCPKNPHMIVTVVHGALRFKDRGIDNKGTRAMCLYGQTDGTSDPVTKFPTRIYEWTDSWKDQWPEAAIVFGHTPVDEVEHYGEARNCTNVDTGCAFGGKLTAYNPFTGEVLEVHAARDYSKDE